MSDHTLSSLRRRARQTGSTEDRAAELRAMLRLAPACERCGGAGGEPGQVVAPRERRGEPRWVPCPSCAGTGSPLRARLDLAAWCGDEAARAVVGAPSILCDHVPSAQTRQPPRYRCVRCDETGGQPVDTAPLAAWLAGLSRWSDVGPVPGWVLVRAAVAAARVALEEMRCDEPHSSHPAWQAPPGHRAASCGSGAAPRLAIESAGAWLDDPTEERRSAAQRAGNPHDALTIGDADAWWRQFPNLLMGERCAAPAACLEMATRSAARLAGEQPVREAICKALVAFALEDA